MGRARNPSSSLLMKNKGIKVGVAVCLVGFWGHVSNATALSGLVEFSTDASGNFFNGSVWNTRGGGGYAPPGGAYAPIPGGGYVPIPGGLGGDTAVNLWVIRGTNLLGVFVNGPSDPEAGISIPLAEGEYSFVVYGNQGGPTPHHALNLFFNGNNVKPRISVFAPTQTSPEAPYPAFSTNTIDSTLTLAYAPVAAAKTLVFQDGTNLIELVDYRWADFSVYEIDRVSQLTTEPDGT